jgi:hypothetical protein
MKAADTWRLTPNRERVGGLTADAIRDRNAATVVPHISEVIAVPGVPQAGPLPPEIQAKPTMPARSHRAAPDQPLLAGPLLCRPHQADRKRSPAAITCGLLGARVWTHRRRGWNRWNTE